MPDLFVDGWEDLYEMDAWFENEARLRPGTTSISFETEYGDTLVVVEDAELKDGRMPE